MAHNFLHSSPAQGGMSLPGDPKVLIDRFLDAIWMERGLSENTLGAYRADLLALNQRFANTQYRAQSMTLRRHELSRHARVAVAKVDASLRMSYQHMTAAKILQHGG